MRLRARVRVRLRLRLRVALILENSAAQQSVWKMCASCAPGQGQG